MDKRNKGIKLSIDAVRARAKALSRSGIAAKASQPAKDVNDAPPPVDGQEARVAEAQPVGGDRTSSPEPHAPATQSKGNQVPPTNTSKRVCILKISAAISKPQPIDEPCMSVSDMDDDHSSIFSRNHFKRTSIVDPYMSFPDDDDIPLVFRKHVGNRYTDIVKGSSSTDLQAHSKPKTESSSADLQVHPVGGSDTRGDRAPPSNGDPSLTGATVVSDAPPIAASSTPCKRAHLDVPGGNSQPAKGGGAHIPFPCSIDNHDFSFLADEEFTWNRESAQRLVNGENVDMLKEISIADLTNGCYSSIANTLDIIRQLSKQGRYYQGKTTELEEKRKARDAEVDRLRKENTKISAVCEKAEKSLDHEIVTGEKFLKSKAGNERLKEAKNAGVDEFKKSEAFHNEILNAAENVYDQAIKACRQRAFPR